MLKAQCSMTKVWTVTLLAVGIWSLAIGHRALNAQSARTSWDGVYTEAQAASGDKLYAANCAACHGEGMRGGPGAPNLSGPEFQFSWNKKTVAGLFDYAKAFMPPGQAGSLSDAQYADLIAALLKVNGFPAGAGDLPSTKADLDAITILTTKP